MVYASIVPRGWERKVKAVTLSRGFVGFGCLMGGVMFRGCFRQVCRSDPDEDRDATWSWSREISVFVMRESCACRMMEVSIVFEQSCSVVGARVGVWMYVFEFGIRIGGGGGWWLLGSWCGGVGHLGAGHVIVAGGE